MCDNLPRYLCGQRPATTDSRAGEVRGLPFPAPGEEAAGRRRTADRITAGVEYETVQEQNAWTGKRDWQCYRRPSSRTSCSARNPLDNYFVDGRLIRINRLPVGGLGLLTVGFRITDRPKEKWTRRFNRFKYGEPAAARAATRTFCAAFEDFRPPGNPRVVVVSSVSSGQNIVQDDTPASTLASALAGSRGWEWLPHHVTKDRHPRITGLPSAAERDSTVDGVYLAAPIGGEPGLVLVVDDFCTRGATLADIARAVRESNPGWRFRGPASPRPSAPPTGKAS